MQARYAKTLGTPEHDTIKAKKQARYANILGAVKNLEIFQFPNGTPSLNKLEKVIIGKRIPFAKIIVMPKSQFTKIKGAMCNVPIETDNICNILPRGIDSNGLILLKLKMKLCYCGHLLFEPMRLDVFKETLNYLKQNNSLYSDIEINIGNIPLNLLSLDKIPIERG